MARAEYRGARRRRLTAAWLVVLLLHLMLALVLIRSAPSQRSEDSPKPTARITVRLLPLAPIEPVPTESRPANHGQAREASPPSTTAIRANAKVLSAPASISPPMMSAAPEAAAAAPEPGASAPPKPLDLAVKPGKLEPDVRSQALSDPRANTRSNSTPEMRMAQSLGDGRATEESLGDGRRRFRQNGKCLQSQPTRASQLDPFGHVAMPNLIGEC
ncbi:hypothetical protein BH11PSE9_BH11PSE9_25630 [soil metagenome]